MVSVVIKNVIRCNKQVAEIELLEEYEGPLMGEKCYKNMGASKRFFAKHIIRCNKQLTQKECLTDNIGILIG
jgi:hypothetical protein